MKDADKSWRVWVGVGGDGERERVNCSLGKCIHQKEYDKLKKRQDEGNKTRGKSLLKFLFPPARLLNV